MTLNQTHAEYLMPDGAPRFGIRTEAASVEPVPATKQQPEPGHAADQAALLTAPQLRSAVDYRFVLDDHADDEQFIAALRDKYPEELAAAQAVVADRLGSPREWFKASRRRFSGTIVGMGVEPVRQLRTLLAYLALTAVPLVVLAAAVLLKLEDWATWTVVIIAVLGLKPAQRKIYRKVRGAISTAIGPEDLQMIWDDVVNATLIEVLAAKDVTTDAMSVHAARRRFNHIRYVAGLTGQLLDQPTA